MPAFLEDFNSFLGTGEKNEEGVELSEFLRRYDPGEYPNPSVTADILVFQYKNGNLSKNLKLLMIRRKNHPCIGHWALPGGFVNIREDIDAAAKRELEEETGLKDVAMEQLYCFGGSERDPRTRIVTVSYLAMIEEEVNVKAGDDAADAVWFEVSMKEVGEGREAGGRWIKDYRIELKNQERGLKLSAVVEKSENPSKVVKEVNYKTLTKNQIAFDHPCFIAQAIDYLKKVIS